MSCATLGTKELYSTYPGRVVLVEQQRYQLSGNKSKKHPRTKYLEWPIQHLILKMVSADTSTPFQIRQLNIHKSASRETLPSLLIP